jgi:hypothetical protein
MKRAGTAGGIERAAIAGWARMPWVGGRYRGVATAHLEDLAERGRGEMALGEQAR